MMIMTKMNKIINWLDLLVKILFGLMIAMMPVYIIFPILPHWIMVFVFCILALCANATAIILEIVSFFLGRMNKK